MAALKLHLHVGEGGLGAVPEPNEAVVPVHEEDEQRREQPHEDEEGGEHAAYVGTSRRQLERLATKTASSPPVYGRRSNQP